MLAQSRSPQQLSPSELDAYLAQGWFRMGQTIFTTNFLRSQGQICSTIWLRVLLTEYSPDLAQVKLFKRNANFSYVNTPSIYNTYEVTVRDGNKLIAIGFFDMGQASAEGIISVYDPAYKKYSLGKYLIYQKMQYCQQMNLQYFYPGYFVPGNPNFDYKLSIGRSALQFFQLRTQRWLGIDVFSDENIPYQVMFDKLRALQKNLAQLKLESKVLNYEYFDASLIPDLREAELFDFPVFLLCAGHSEDIVLLIVYDVCDARYHLLQCLPFWKPDVPNADPAYYSVFVLKVLYKIHSSDHPEEMATVFAKFDQA